MPNAIYQAALDALEAELAPIEKPYKELVSTINALRARAGLPPRPGSSGGGSSAEGDAASSGAIITDIKSDTFVGKRLRSATKEYLNIRRAKTGDGPATPRDIYDGLLTGGYEFSSNKEETRLVVLRNMLRKRSEVFKKFDSGKYGLNEWYGIVPKKPKAATHDDDNDNEDEVAEVEEKTDTASEEKIIRRRV